MCTSDHLQEAGLDLQLREPGVLTGLRRGRRQRLEARQQVRGRREDGLGHQQQLRARLLQCLNHLPRAQPTASHTEAHTWPVGAKLHVFQQISSHGLLPVPVIALRLSFF